MATRLNHGCVKLICGLNAQICCSYGKDWCKLSGYLLLNPHTPLPKQFLVGFNSY